MTLLVAANQISKSSTQIRKCIEWAGNPKLWPKLWKADSPPKMFWYLYPDRATASREFKLKWVPEFLPRGEFKNHETYGWQEYYKDGQIHRIEFESGVTIYFLAYAQDVHNLQSGTVHAIFCDEELPAELYNELTARLYATDGYFHMVFTATLNQDMWKRAMEGRGDAELFPDALKMQISMRDCFTYKDGTPGAYNEEKVKRIEASCPTETERARRVDGRFVTELGRKYSQFDSTRHYIKPHPIAQDWKKYVAVDIGGGGKTAHPPAICFVAIRPDHRYGVVYKGWRGDDGLDYTSGDILSKFTELRGQDLCVLQKFDQNAKDFGVLAVRMGEPFIPSDKSHERGEDVINTLFKSDMIMIFDEPELQKLGGELGSLMKSTRKEKAKDDFCDAFRYCVVDIPWDWSALKGEPSFAEAQKVREEPYTEAELMAMEIEARRGEFYDPRKPKEDAGWEELEDEFREQNELYG